MSDTIKVELTTLDIEDGNYEALLDKIYSIGQSIDAGNSKTVTIELTIKNEDEPEVEETIEEETE